MKEVQGVDIASFNKVWLLKQSISLLKVFYYKKI